MGIKSFYKRFRYLFPDTIMDLDSIAQQQHDILVIELNGLLYHVSKENHKDWTNFFQSVCDHMLNIILKYPPRNSIYLVFDGFAPMMKYKEQLHRRYRNMITDQHNSFDLNNFTPGTNFLNLCAKYMDWYLRYQMNRNDILKNLEIFFSNEKMRGEGEFKAMKFLYTFSEKKKVLVLSKDTDWIPLSLLLPKHLDVFICREISENQTDIISIDRFKKQLLQKYSFDTQNMEQSFCDFYLIFLFIGNDHFPQLHPSFDLDQLCHYYFHIYKECRKHFVTGENSKTLDIPNIISFLLQCDLEKYSQHNDNKNNDQENPLSSPTSIVSSYLYNLQNVFHMNSNQPFDWNFLYFPNRTPTFQEFLDYSTHLQNHQTKRETKYNTDECLYRLFLLLPHTSRILLPKALQNYTHDLHSIRFDLKMNKFVFELNEKYFQNHLQYYLEKKKDFLKEEKRLNFEGQVFQYSFNENKNTYFKSMYGNIARNKVVVTKCPFL